MHALSKKHYYDVMKSGQEVTILESDSSKVDCEREDTPTSDVGCYARTHMKSNAIQTHGGRNTKNFRNEYTVTSDLESGDMSGDPLDSSLHRAQSSSIHCSRSYEDVAVIRKRSSQATGASSQATGASSQATGARNHQDPLLKTAPKLLVESAVECVKCSQIKQRVGLESKATKTENLGCDECIQCAPKISVCNCRRYIPCNRGLAACRTFTLGTLESHRFQNEQCKTKLIGGCRVPVCKDYKNRF